VFHRNARLGVGAHCAAGRSHRMRLLVQGGSETPRRFADDRLTDGDAGLEATPERRRMPRVSRIVRHGRTAVPDSCRLSSRTGSAPRGAALAGGRD
jgi:hypothetical protein